jgi:hypothetical protein
MDMSVLQNEACNFFPVCITDTEHMRACGVFRDGFGRRRGYGDVEGVMFERMGEGSKPLSGD